MSPDPADRKARLNQARSHLQQGRPAQAEAILRPCVTADGKDAEALELLGICRFHQHDPADAIALLQSAFGLAPGRPTIANTLGAVLLASGDAAGALAAFDRALERAPDYGGVWNNRGNALSELGRFAEAVASYRRAASHLPKDANVAVALGQTLLALDRPLEALAEYERALACEPTHVAARHSLAMVRHRVILHTLTAQNHHESEIRAGVTAFADGLYETAAQLLETHAGDSATATALAATAHHYAAHHETAQRLYTTLPAGNGRSAAEVLAAEFQPRVEAAIALRAFREHIFDSGRDVLPAPLAERPRIHLVAQMANRAGTELRTLGLAGQLRDDAEVTIWANGGGIHPDFQSQDIRLLQSDGGEAPADGTLVLLGAWQTIGAWYARGSFRRVIVVYNVDNPTHLARMLATLCLPGKPRIELVFAGRWLQEHIGLPGVIEPSPIDLDRFAAATRTANDFVVGRLSRDDPYKFHTDAAACFARLAGRGIRVRLMGATVLAPQLAGQPGIEVLPAGVEAPERFLQRLDCFLYRTHPYFRECWGRVVTEAMASGLPVVVHRSGGYADIIEHGRNGFLFDRHEEAEAIVETLRADPDLRQRIGQAARLTIEATLGEASRQANSRYYRR